MLFAIARECLECSYIFLRACPVRPTNTQLGTNLDCTVASRVVQCCWGWSGGAMVLGKLPVPGRPTSLEKL